MKRSGFPSVQDVAVGALLHDIGKLLQRTSNLRLTDEQKGRASDILPVIRGRHSHWHALWTDAFFDLADEQGLSWPKGVSPSRVRDLAVHHHRPSQECPDATERTAAELVTVANQLASGYARRPRDIEDEMEERHRDRLRRIPLAAIVPALSLGGIRPGRTGHHVPGELGANAILPSPNQEGPESGERAPFPYDGVLKGLLDGWRELAVMLGPDADARLFEEALVCLLERWLWAVPCSTIDEPDVSLFDHSRVVAGFAAALYQHHRARDELASADAIRDSVRPKFRFLVGDLSGLQPTLFRFQRERIRGLNRILRGRSLKFQLIADAGARLALREFDMPWSAALQTAGGRFLILLPELGDEEMEARTDRLRTTCDDWMAREYTGDLGLGLALSRPFSVHDLVRGMDEADDSARNERARRVREDLAVTTETAKLQQLQNPAEAAILALDYPHGACGACGVRPARRTGSGEHEDHCVSCRTESELGRRFPKSSRVLINGGHGGSGIFGLEYALGGDGSGGTLGWSSEGKEGSQTGRRRCVPVIAMFRGSRRRKPEGSARLKIMPTSRPGTSRPSRRWPSLRCATAGGEECWPF